MASNARIMIHELQSHIDDAGGWNDTDAWEEMVQGMEGSGSQYWRFRNLGDWNGVSYPL